MKQNEANPERVCMSRTNRRREWCITFNMTTTAKR